MAFFTSSLSPLFPSFYTTFVQPGRQAGCWKGFRGGQRWSWLLAGRLGLGLQKVITIAVVFSLRGLEAQNSDHPPLFHIKPYFFLPLPCIKPGAVRLVKPCEVERTSRNKCDTRCYLAILIIISYAIYDPFSAQGDMMMNYRDPVESRLIVGTLDPQIPVAAPLASV